MNTSLRPDPMSVVRQLSLLMSLAEAIRAQLEGAEFACFRRAKQGRRVLACIEGDLCIFETAGDRVARYPFTVPEAIRGAVGRILGSARRE